MRRLCGVGEERPLRWKKPERKSEDGNRAASGRVTDGLEFRSRVCFRWVGFFSERPPLPLTLAWLQSNPTWNRRPERYRSAGNITAEYIYCRSGIAFLLYRHVWWFCNSGFFRSKFYHVPYMQTMIKSSAFRSLRRLLLLNVAALVHRIDPTHRDFWQETASRDYLVSHLSPSS